MKWDALLYHVLHHRLFMGSMTLDLDSQHVSFHTQGWRLCVPVDTELLSHSHAFERGKGVTAIITPDMNVMWTLSA